MSGPILFGRLLLPVIKITGDYIADIKKPALSGPEVDGKSAVSSDLVYL